MTEFPSYTKLEHQPGNAAQSLLAELNSALVPAERRLSEFTQEAQRQLDQALSVQRNSAGALDLDVAGLRATASAMEARAIAAREVANATAIAARENRDESESAKLARVATEALAVEYRDAAAAARSHAEAATQVQAVLDRQKSATEEVVNAQLRGTTALGAVTNSVRSNRVAFVQLGQQMQDVVVQAQMGTNAFQIFAQQAPQAAFALSGLEGKAGSAAARIGSLATFLSGPWGAAIFAATAVLGPFIYSLFQSGEEADKAEDQHRSLTAVLTDVKASYEEVTEALAAYNRQQEQSRAVTLATLNAQLAATQANYDEAISKRTLLAAELDRIAGFATDPTFAEGGAAYAGLLRQQAALISQNEAEIAQSRSARANATVQVAGRAAEIANDPTAAIRDRFETRRQELAQEGLSVDALTAAYTRLGAEERAALDAAQKSGGGGGRERSTRARREERNETARYIEALTNEIARIGQTESQLRALEVSRQMATASTDAERRAIQQLSEAREQALALEERRQLANDVQDMVAQSEQSLAIQRLQLAGREDEAQVLQIMWSLEEKRGDAAWDHLGTIRDMVDAEREQTEEIKRRQALQSAYLDTTRAIRGELESLFSGEGFNVGKIARQLQSRVFVEQMFGDALRQIDREVQSGFDDHVDYMGRELDRAGQSALTFADTLNAATTAVASGGQMTFEQAFSGYGATGAANDNANSDKIVVTGLRSGGSTLAGMSPQEYFDLVGRRLAAPIIDSLETQFGKALPAELSGALSGAIGGYLGAGPVGGILGGLQGLFPTSGLAKGAFGGAAQGSQIAGLFKSLGLGGSTTGAQIGGAIGSALPIPGGDIIGAIAGSMIGSLFKSAPYGTASFGGGTGFNVTAKGKGRADGANDLGNSFQDALDAIAEQLDAQIGEFAVSIGTFKDEFRVSSTGKSGKLKKGADITSYASAAEANAAALMDAIADGAIKGITAGEQRYLAQAKDLEKALSDVLDFRSVFERLKAYKDPVGAALDELDDEFSRLRRLFGDLSASAGEYAQLEELYGIERAQAIRDATEQMTGSLKALLDELKIGDSGLSLRDRRANALTEYDALKSRVQAGDTTAFDDFAEASRALLDIERQMFGSQSGYFSRFFEVKGVTETALSEQERLVNAAINRDSPLSGASAAANTSLITAIDRNGNAQIEQLIAVNDNLARLGNLMAAQVGGKKNKLALAAGFTDNF